MLIESRVTSFYFNSGPSEKIRQIYAYYLVLVSTGLVGEMTVIAEWSLWILTSLRLLLLFYPLANSPMAIADSIRLGPLQVGYNILKWTMH